MISSAQQKDRDADLNELRKMGSDSNLKELIVKAIVMNGHNNIISQTIDLFMNNKNLNRNSINLRAI